MEQHKSLIDRFVDWAVARHNGNSPIESILESRLKQKQKNYNYAFKIGDHVKPKQRNSENKSISNGIILGCVEGNYFMQISSPIADKEYEGVKKLEVYPKSFIENNFEKISQLQ